MRKLKIISLILIVLFLSGCWDKVEIEELGYISVIGLDEGENNKILITFLVTNPQMGTSSTSQVQEPASDIITLLSSDIIAAKDLAGISVARQLTFSHVKAIVASEELAKSDKLFSLVEAAERDRDFRRATNFMICKEKATEFIRNCDPPFDTRVAKYYEFMALRWKDTGLVPLSNIHRLSQRTVDNLSLFLATYATTKQEVTKKEAENEGDYLAGQVDKKEINPTQMMGSAVFKKGKMVAKITGDETRMALLLRPKIITNNILVTFPDPLKEGERISAKLVREKNKINIDVDNSYPIIDVNIPIQLTISAIPSFIDYVENQKNQEILKSSIEDYLEDKAMRLVKKTQREFAGEPFQWSTIARRKFWLYEEFEKYDWMKKYTEAKVTVNFEVKIEDFGKAMAPPKIGK